MSGLEELKGYARVGSHGFVKTCLWLRKSLRNEGVCYKEKFYGIRSHRCIQMTPSGYCNNFCVYCWRPAEMMESPDRWDPPETICEESIEAQRKLISGFKGSGKTDLKKFAEAMDPKHVAISLTGEPTFYPFLPTLIEEYRKRGMTTFLVTNGTNPGMVERVNPTQLYVSLSSYSREMYMRIQRPSRDQWRRFIETLKIMREKDCRTVLRMTLGKGFNMFHPEKYSELIRMASPDFVEVKAYMHLGYSRRRLDKSAMPSHMEIAEFSQELSKFSGYRIVDESEPSRVVLLER